MTKGDPVEIMARAMMIDPDEDGGPGTDLLYRAQLSIAALEAAGFVIVHPNQTTDEMMLALHEEALKHSAVPSPSVPPLNGRKK